MQAHKKGFTLLELLIVMGIIVILTGVLVTVINPAELLRRARDTRRLNDLAILNRALALYVTDVQTPLLDNTTNNTTCFGGTASTTVYLSATTGATSTLNPYGTGTYVEKLASPTNYANVNGAGWIPVNLTSISSGAPISALPIDPTNTASSSTTPLYYAYACNGTALTWQLDAVLESTLYGTKASTDGGTDPTLYEMGTAAGLTLIPTSTGANFYSGK